MGIYQVELVGKTMDFWDLMIKKDDWILSTIENLRNFKVYVQPTKLRVRKAMRNLPKEGIGKDLFVVLNAPSLKTQDLSVLSGKTTMFVNRGFMHPLYKDLQPAYHVFVDPKMIKGVWPVEWLGEIHTLSPKTKILLPLAWYDNPMFKPYHEFIYWLNWRLPFYNLGVSGECFSFAIQQQFETIYFTGFDATGIGYELINSSESHFYGNDQELQGKKTTQFVVDLLMHSRHLHDLNRLSSYCEKRDIRLVNITNGGLLDMFKREEILPIIKS